MHATNGTNTKVREIIFYENDYFDEAKMINKLDNLIEAFATELHQKTLIEQIPDTEEGWTQLFKKEFGLNDIKEGWEAYAAGSLKFFLELKQSILHSDFLKENDIYRSYRFLNWKAGLKAYWNPLLEKLMMEFYKTYCMILDNIECSKFRIKGIRWIINTFF